MRLTLPGPGDLVAAAASVRDTVGASLDLLPRMAALLGQVEALVERVETLVDRLDDVLDAAEDTVTAVTAVTARSGAVVDAVEITTARSAAVVDAVEATTTRSGAVVDAVEATTLRSAEVIDRVEGSTGRASDAVAGAQGIVNRMDPLLSAYEPALRSLAPVLARFASTTSTEEVTAAVTMIERLPRLVVHLDEDLLPLLATLDKVGPDIHELLEVVQDLRRVATGLPGIGFLRRRGEDDLPPEDRDRA